MMLMPRQLAMAVFAIIAVIACRQSEKNAISVRNAWANATPAGATVGAAYLELTVADQDTLLSATSEVADRIEMHASSEENGMMRMRPLPTVELQPGKPFAFAPGGAHFMLLGLRQPLVAGTRFPLTLQLQNAGALTLQVDVKEPGSR
jgi:copper(I)-binding protein